MITWQRHNGYFLLKYCICCNVSLSLRGCILLDLVTHTLTYTRPWQPCCKGHVNGDPTRGALQAIKKRLRLHRAVGGTARRISEGHLTERGWIPAACQLRQPQKWRSIQERERERSRWFVKSSCWESSSGQLHFITRDSEVIVINCQFSIFCKY